MSDLYKIVGEFESKILKILNKHTVLQQENNKLLALKNKLEHQLNQQKQQIEVLEKKEESLRVANAIVGSKEDRYITKLKINTWIREIDKCVVALSE